MDIDRRLHWVSRNRARKPREQQVGVPVVRLLERLAGPDADELRKLAERIAPAVDDQFRAHCRIGMVDAATLAVNVDSPALVYAMRARWLAKLQQALLAGRRRIGRIVFAYSGDGLRLDDVSER